MHRARFDAIFRVIFKSFHSGFLLSDSFQIKEMRWKRKTKLANNLVCERRGVSTKQLPSQK